MSTATTDGTLPTLHTFPFKAERKAPKNMKYRSRATYRCHQINQKVVPDNWQSPQKMLGNVENKYKLAKQPKMNCVFLKKGRKIHFDAPEECSLKTAMLSARFL